MKNGIGRCKYAGSNMRFVKIRANALYGDPRHRYNIYNKRGDEE